MKAILENYETMRQEIHIFNAKTNNSVSIYQSGKTIGLQGSHSMSFCYDVLRELLSGKEWVLDLGTSRILAHSMIRRFFPRARINNTENRSNLMNELKVFWDIPTSFVNQGLGNYCFVSINAKGNEIVLRESNSEPRRLTITELLESKS